MLATRGKRSGRTALACAILAGGLVVAGARRTTAQSPSEELPYPREFGGEELPPGSRDSEADAADIVPGEPIYQVRIIGQEHVSIQKIHREIQSRQGRPFDLHMVEEDVRRLNRTGLFLHVRTSYQRLPEGLVVYFHFVERPTMRYVKYVGNERLKRRSLEKTTGLKPGDPLDPYAIDEARRKLEDFYLSKGYAKATVKVVEGDRADDQGVVFLIHEGRKQKIFKIDFVGCQIASAARLKTQIESKSPFLYLFGGEVDREKIDRDVDRLTAYYRSLGFFRARIGRELEFNEEQNWLTLTFVIDEGPRYRVRNVSFIGHSRFTSAELADGLELAPGEYFNQAALSHDLALVQDRYGSLGYIFAAATPETRFLEEPGQLDLLYEIEEGDRYRVGKIEIDIRGENPHTRRNTILNRLSLRPGDIVDIRELRASERRLKASGLFLNNPAEGVEPKIVLSPPDFEDESQLADRPGSGYRGQSPDGGRERAIDFVVTGTLKPRDSAADGAGDASVGEGSAGAQEPTGRSRGTSVRFQSPSRTRKTSPDDGPVAGQLPMGRTGPDAIARRPTARAPAELLRGRYAEALRHASQDPFLSRPRLRGQSPADGPASEQIPEGNGYAGPEELFPDDESFFDDNPTREISPEVIIEETETGRFMLGVSYNTNAGVFGNVIIDEQNFDWRRLPRSWNDIIEGKAWRGSGQQLRIEAYPGNFFSRYMISFRDPYFFDTPYSFGTSGYFFMRGYQDWDEERLGGRVSLGYQFPDNPDLSVAVFFRGEKVNISNPRFPTPASLASVVGDNGLFSAGVTLTHDTRDSAFLPTEGHLLNLGFEQAFGDFDFPRVTVGGRKYFLMHQRPDGSGRHVLGVGSDFGYTGTGTPIFENFYAGGLNSLRGFFFRSASPQDMGVLVGGRFEFLNFVEYMFPLTADDALRAIVFCDFGTIERELELNGENFRVSPGIGLRIAIPAMGPQPIALDFAVPVTHAPGDRIQNFTFSVGTLR